MGVNVDNLILDTFRSISVKEYGTDKIQFRIRSIEDGSLKCTSEAEEVTDARGALITKLYRSKKGELTGSSSLFSLDLAAAQYGTKKQIATKDNQIIVPTYEILKPKDGKVTLSHVPVEDIKYIYQVIGGDVGSDVDGADGYYYEAGAAASEKNFVHKADGDTPKEITLPTGLTGKVYVEYKYKSENANRVINKYSEFPKLCSLVAYVKFRDKCNENIVYTGAIIANKAKLNPEDIEIALTTTGKHPFTFEMMHDYCDEEDENGLYEIIVFQ